MRAADLCGAVHYPFLKHSLYCYVENGVQHQKVTMKAKAIIIPSASPQCLLGLHHRFSLPFSLLAGSGSRLCHPECVHKCPASSSLSDCGPQVYTCEGTEGADDALLWACQYRRLLGGSKLQALQGPLFIHQFSQTTADHMSHDKALENRSRVFLVLSRLQPPPFPPWLAVLLSHTEKRRPLTLGASPLPFHFLSSDEACGYHLPASSLEWKC